jgi:hypothetical protein
MATRLFYLRTSAAMLVALSIHASAHAQGQVATEKKNLVVVELFESQGCPSCPPADKNLTALAGRPQVLALSFGVTYFDDSDWKDTFASEAYTSRQWLYAHYQHRNTVWTPQVYVNGHTDIDGANRAALNKGIDQARSHGPAITWPSADHVEIKSEPGQREASEVWLVRYDPRTLHVPIGGGANRGQTLDQTHVVRELIRLGAWQGDDVVFSLPPPLLSGLDDAVLVQVKDGGDILSASVLHGGVSRAP